MIRGYVSCTRPHNEISEIKTSLVDGQEKETILAGV